MNEAMFPIYRPGSMFKWDEKSRVEDERKQAIEDETNWRRICAHVNRRDDYRCRCCGRACNPWALSMLGKAHHHHIQFRSDLGPDTVENVCLLCADCHNEVHNLKRLEVRGNGEVALEFWRLNREDGSWFLWRREIGIHQVEKD